MHLGLIYALLAIGIYISFRILDIPDLSAEGTFTFGLATSAAFTAAGHPFLAIFAGMIAGFIGGSVTGILQTKIGIHPILAGILTMSGLYSVNLAIMGSRSNIALVGIDTLFRLAFDAFPMLSKDTVRLMIALIFCLIVVILLALFFKTHIGLCIRATGDNEKMVRASSINVDATKILTFALSNGCIALSGALLAQYQGFADISSGIGIIAVGLASVIIGEQIFGKGSVTKGLITVALGSVIYRFIIAIALKSSLFPAYYLKIVSALIVAIALAIPAAKSYIQFQKMKQKGLQDAKNH